MQRRGQLRLTLTATAFLVAPAGCGSALYLTAQGAAPRPPADVFQCVRDQIPVVGYSQMSNDAAEGRLSARRYDWDTRIADTRFRRIVERLDVEVKPSANGGASLKVVVHTFAEFTTQRGPTEVEQKASLKAGEAAEALLQACGH